MLVEIMTAVDVFVKDGPTIIAAVIIPLWNDIAVAHKLLIP